MSTAAQRLAEIRNRIARAERIAGRPAGSTTLVAVSKTFGQEDVREVIAAGQRIFGENRVQEAKAKWPELRAETAGIELHLIGPLQSNKAAEAVAQVQQAVQGLDLLAALAEMVPLHLCLALV